MSATAFESGRAFFPFAWECCECILRGNARSMLEAMDLAASHNDACHSGDRASQDAPAQRKDTTE